MDRQLERIREMLDIILFELQRVNRILEESGNHSTVDQILLHREQSLANYRQEYERQHGVFESNSDDEDEID